MIPLFIALGAILLIFILGGLYAYFQAFYAKAGKKNINKYFDNNQSFREAKGEMQKLIEMMDSLPMEEVYIKSFDGIKLYGRYYHVKEGAPVHILMHGYKGNAKRDMCGGHYLARLLEHNILLIDQRGCGKSEGNTITFGVKERRDALSWVEYITKRFGDVSIFLVGVSMGAATALMTADMDLPSNVRGIVADCPYSSPEAIIKKVCRDRGMPEMMYPFVVVGASLFGRFKIGGTGAVYSVKNAKVPILIAHGKNDGFVPHQMAEEIYNVATGEKELYSCEGADHGMSYMTDPQRYEEVVCGFIKRCLK